MRTPQWRGKELRELFRPQAAQTRWFDKNQLEYIYKSKKMRTTCMFGIIYVILGNLSGNAVVFGLYILHAAGIEGRDSTVRGLAVICMTAACLLHAAWRKGGIVLNNLLAVLKSLILVAIVIIGFATSAGASFGHGHVHGQTISPTTNKSTSNFDPHSSFTLATGDPAGYAASILFIVYSFSGYEQPFYVCHRTHSADETLRINLTLNQQVLSEVHRPKKTFAKSTITAQTFVIILFMLVNIAYVSAMTTSFEHG